MSKINPNIFRLINKLTEDDPKIGEFINDYLLWYVLDKGSNYRAKEDIREIIEKFFSKELIHEN